MYKQIAHITDDKLQELQSLIKNVTWKTVKGSGADFQTYFPSASRNFFLKIPPGGKVHKHVDTPRPTETYHIPIQTNEESISYMYEPEKKAYHLEVGKVYWVNRDLPHESINNGSTDRIHYLIEC